MNSARHDIAADAAIEIHTAIRRIIWTHPAIKQGGKALDAAAGTAYMSRWLWANGFIVTAMDIVTDGWNMSDIECKYSDFNRGIDAPDAIFDLVVSIETIEHLENPFHFLREISRVLKSGGIGIISTPNTHSIRSRIKYFIVGLSRLFEYVADDHMGNHITPVNIGQFLHAFRQARMKLVDVYSVGPRNSFLLSTVLSLLYEMTFIDLKYFRKSRKSYPDHYVNALSDKRLRVLMNHGFLIVIAEKVD